MDSKQQGGRKFYLQQKIFAHRIIHLDEISQKDYWQVI
jgi:hypothetical protein